MNENSSKRWLKFVPASRGQVQEDMRRKFNRSKERNKQRKEKRAFADLIKNYREFSSMCLIERVSVFLW